ncbi:MAG: hypothetical protein PHU25_01430 [Deltaproteobacteria bacterium]|nr:hypothetical protein [Deltaproteobacteria bacterium]
MARPRLKPAWLAAAILITAWAAGPALAVEPAVHATVDAAIDEDGAAIEGTVRLEIRNDTPSPLESIPLWLYPNRLAEPNPGLDARTVKWVYPGGASPASMTVASPSWQGVPLAKAAIGLSGMPVPGTPPRAKDVLATVRLPHPLAPGETGELGLKFRTKIPQRAGRFGRWNGVAVLGGGWFPAPLTDLTGRATGLPPDVMRVDVRLRLPAGRGAVIHDRVFEPSVAARTLRVDGIETECLTVVIMDLMDVAERDVGGVRAAYVSRHMTRREPTWKDTRRAASGLPEGLPDLGSRDAHARALGVVANTVRLLRAAAPGIVLPDRVVIVEASTRDSLVQDGGGPVIVSDRLWRLMPIDVALWFHDLALARVVGSRLVRPTVRALEGPRMRDVAADAVGSLLASRYSAQVHGKARSVSDILGFAGFLPVIDNLLYAPEVPFREVYFGGVEEPDPLRDEPWRFMNRLPRGKRILGKLEDLLGEDAARELFFSYVRGAQNLEATVTSRLGAQASAAFFDAWLSDYPRVNYRIGRADDAPSGARFVHRVEVVRDGDMVHEPVRVRIEDEDGRSADVTWNGAGRSGVVEWESAAPLERAEIDPEHRLTESAFLTDEHPLADNATSLPMRPPVLTQLVVWYDVVENEPTLEVGFAVRRRYDLTNTFTVDGGVSPRGYDGFLGYYRSFGPKRTLNAREWYAGPSAGAVRYLPQDGTIVGLPESAYEGATMGSIGLFLGRDDRTYMWDPMSGMAFSLSATYSAGRSDDGGILHVGSFAGRIFGLLSPGVHHTFALYGGAVGLVGNPVAADLVTLSDRLMLRAFDSDETYGRLGFYAVAEWRHTLVSPGEIQISSLAWLDRLQGALFAAGGTVSDPGGYGGLFTADRMLAEVGYGLRFHWLVAGVVQYLIAVDFAVPLHPLDRERVSILDDGSTETTPRTPFKLTLGITQTY